jgi:hypothetical protein
MTVEADDYYVIVPSLTDVSRQQVMSDFAAKHGAAPVADEFRYSSGRNTDWLTVEALRRLIVEHVDSSFKV